MGLQRSDGAIPESSLVFGGGGGGLIGGRRAGRAGWWRWESEARGEEAMEFELASWVSFR
jgi:hypothetical protein